ncbi:MAG: response regulator [Dehalococcoidia bacterium]|nr:response regulator [Dehalococcoidia bacterium]MDW8120258.1 response regulator [Chloroflexota bacterium]
MSDDALLRTVILDSHTPGALSMPFGGDGLMDASGVWRILIVEDQEDLRDLLALTFSGGPFEVHLARDGQKALEMAYHIRPHLVITDLRMPRMDGLALTRALRQDPVLGRVPVIVITAWADPGAELQVYGAGGNAFFAKPFSPLALLERAEHLLREYRRGG